MDPYLTDISHRYAAPIIRAHEERYGSYLDDLGWDDIRALIEQAYYDGWIRGREDKESETR